MKIIQMLPCGRECNSYAVTEDNENCILIDCPNGNLLESCREMNLTPRTVLLTHGHLDHMAGCEVLQKSGADIYCGVGEKEFIFSEANKSIFGVELPDFSIDKTLNDGDEIELYGVKIKVVATPGHTAGGVCYIIENNLFVGDTLFFRSVGRTDFPTGDASALVKSIKKLYALDFPWDCRVLCGHGGPTTLDSERKLNPYVRQKDGPFNS